MIKSYGWLTAFEYLKFKLEGSVTVGIGLIGIIEEGENGLFVVWESIL